MMHRESTIRKPAMSFIVRVWEDGDGADTMRGEIENVGTGEKRFFLDYWSLLHLLEAWRHDPEPVG